MYRLFEANLVANEQRDAAVIFRYGGIKFRLVHKRYYEHCGALYRLIYLSRPYAKSRPDGPLEAEVTALQIAAWVCRKHYSTGPSILKLAYLESGENESGGSGPVIAETKIIAYKAVSDELATELLISKLDPIVANFDAPQGAFPECSLEEKYGCSYNPYRKCRDFCRSRHVCSQYALVRKQIEDLTLNVEPGAALF